MLDRELFAVNIASGKSTPAVLPLRGYKGIAGITQWGIGHCQNRGWTGPTIWMREEVRIYLLCWAAWGGPATIPRVSSTVIIWSAATSRSI
jgi:hypothetical protein